MSFPRLYKITEVVERNDKVKSLHFEVGEVFPLKHLKDYAASKGMIYQHTPDNGRHAAKIEISDIFKRFLIRAEAV